MRRRPVTVTVCTLNEAEQLPRLLRSVSWADEVLVLDCGSSDGTPAVAAALGARVEHEPWRGFSAQKNEAARRARHDWVLSLDADEVVDDALGEAVCDVLAHGPDPLDGYAVDRRGDFLGTVLPNGARPSKRRSLVRLYHRGRSAWDEQVPVHEVVRCHGRVRVLPGTLLHLNAFTVDQFVELFDRYASTEAAALHAEGRRARSLDLVLRPVSRFVWQYAVRGEWRLGRRGVAHSGLKAVSDFLRYAKLLELDLDERPVGGRPAPRGGATAPLQPEAESA